MVPSEHRLDEVVARLIERLEAARPSFPDPAAAGVAFREIAERHVEAALTEFRALATEDPAAHGAFLAREVLETALPRYARLAAELTAAEQRGFGFGPLASPVAVPALALGALLVFWFGLKRWLGLWETWPAVVALASVPVWPTCAAWLVHRRHRRELESLVDDMQKIQDAERTFLTADELSAARRFEEEAASDRPRAAAARQRDSNQTH